MQSSHFAKREKKYKTKQKKERKTLVLLLTLSLSLFLFSKGLKLTRCKVCILKKKKTNKRQYRIMIHEASFITPRINIYTVFLWGLKLHLRIRSLCPMDMTFRFVFQQPNLFYNGTPTKGLVASGSSQL